MVPAHTRWLIGLLTLTLAASIGCAGSGAQKVGQNPDDPFVPNDPKQTGTITPPSNVSGAAGDRVLTVFFSGVGGAEGYNLYLSTDGSTFFRYNANSPYTTNTIVVSGLVNGQSYYVGVSAVKGNLESGTAYAGGAPAAQPLVPNSEPGPPPNTDAITDVTVWTPTTLATLFSTLPSPPVMTSVPDDRRMLFSWTTRTDRGVSRFQVDFAIAARGTGTTLTVPTGELLVFRSKSVEFNDTATLRDPAFGLYDDPAMATIRTFDTPDPLEVRTEGLLQVNFGQNFVFEIADGLGLDNPADLLTILTSAEYGYTLDDLGISIGPNDELITDQGALDGTGRIGIVIRLQPIGDRPYNAVTTTGTYRDRSPELITGVTALLVPNPSPGEGESPVVPRLGWTRLNYPMGSDVVDYGILRFGEVGTQAVHAPATIFYKMSETDGEDAIFDEDKTSPLREALAWIDDQTPPVLVFETYSYSIFAIDDAGRFGPIQESVVTTIGDPPNQPPALQGTLFQGTTTVFPNGTNVVEAATNLSISFNGTVDPDGTVVTYGYEIAPNAPVVGNNPSLVVPASQFPCPPSDTPIAIRIFAIDNEGDESSITANLTLHSGAACSGSNVFPVLGGTITQGSTSVWSSELPQGTLQVVGGGSEDVSINLSSSTDTPPGTITTYSYQIFSGPVNSSPNPVFTIPAAGIVCPASASDPLQITLRVTDNDGGVTSTTVDLTVVPDAGCP